MVPCGTCSCNVSLSCAGELDAAARIILATDNDAPGNALAEELARRLGRERCFRVRWPGSVAGRDAPEAEADKAYRKDANEVLCKDGPQAIRAYLEAAEPYPIKGLFRQDFLFACGHVAFKEPPAAYGNWGRIAG